MRSDRNSLKRLRAEVAWKWREAERMAASSRPETGTVGIIGAGTMGTAIAAVHLRRRLPVVMTDRCGSALAKAERILQEEANAQRPGIADSDRTSAPWEEVFPKEQVNIPGDAVAWSKLFQATQSPDGLARCDLVIETIPEVIAAKRELYRALEPLLRTDAVLATNTSTISLARLTEGLQRPERFCGMHFFHPVRERPLIEIIRSTHTGEEAIHRVVAHARRLRMLPIVVPDGPGFLINRLLLPYLTEALELVRDGAAFEEVEAAAEEFGMAKGPFRLMDEIGLDTVLHAGWLLSAAFPERIPSSPLLVAMVKAGRTGCKTGRGFWDYMEPAEKVSGQHGSAEGEYGRGARGTQAPVSAEVHAMAESWMRQQRTFRREQLQNRLLLAMLLEAFRILEEGPVREPRDIELGVLFGLGFPLARGGLFAWAEQIGFSKIQELLEPFAVLGPRYRPPQILRDWARQGHRWLSLPEGPDHCSP